MCYFSLFSAGFSLVVGFSGEREMYIDIDDDDTWSHSGQPVVYSNWHSGAPQAGSQNCALFHADTGLWRDKSCGKEFPFICEKAYVA